MEVLLILFIRVVLGVIASKIASSKGRSDVGWFFGGFFLGLLGILIIAVLSNVDEQEKYRKHMERENRRLKEQLRQEQIKSEVFRGHVAHRLDTHDHVLNIDTRKTPTQALPESPNPTFSAIDMEGYNSSSDEIVEPSSQDVIWYYENQGEQFGPLTHVDMFQLVKTGMLHHSCLVWNEKLEDWTPLASVPELSNLL